MAAINIFIADVFELTKINNFQTTLLARVNALYGDCIKFANQTLKKEHTFKVIIPANKPIVTELDYIVYLLPMEFHSIVANSKSSNLLADHWGLTGPKGNGQMASEIIVKATDGDLIGSLVIHELLHYKTGKNNTQLHPSNGLASATVEGGTSLNNANRNDIARTIETKIKPWLDGWDTCANAKLSRDNKDPLWNV